MAQPTNTTDSYDFANSIREDLADVIYDVSPMETPIVSMLAKTKAQSTYHEWQIDELAAASTTVRIEGDETTAAAITAPSRLGNYTAIQGKAVTLSGTYQAVNKAGIGQAMAREMVRRGQELKRDMEKTISDNNARVAGNATTARELAGIPAWITSATSAGSGGADPTGDGTDARTDGTQRSFTETMLLDVMQECWTNGGQPDVLVVGPFNKRVASGFTGVATKTKDVKDKKIIAAADIYVSDFGEIQIVPDRFSRGRDALLLQKDMWALAYLRNMKTEDLAKTGDSDKKQILVEYTLVARNEKANGIIADLTTS